MVIGDSPDWPPPGFTEDVKVTNGRKIKYYTNVETGKKFYSKKEVTRYMNTQDTSLGVTQETIDQDKDQNCDENNVSQMNEDKDSGKNNAIQVNEDKDCPQKNVSQMKYEDKSCPENNVSKIVEGTVESPEWLPAGWIAEVKVRKSGSQAGAAYKCYTNVETGKKFYSKNEVTRYINTKDTSHGVTQEKTGQDKKCDENNVSQMNEDKDCDENNVSQMNEDKDFPENNVNQMNHQDKRCAENNVSKIAEGTTVESPEWLPPGWITEGRARKSGSHAGSTYKVYIDPSTGNKFYSKPEVTKYLETKQKNISEKEQTHGTGGKVSSSNQKASEDSKNIKGQSRISKRQNSDADSPLLGIEEGSISKKKAFRDSEEIGKQSSTSKKQKSGNKRPSKKTSPPHGAGENLFPDEKASQDSKENGVQGPLSKRKKPGTDSPAKTVCSVAVDCSSVDELPPGWKKEVIIRQNTRGTRKDTIYTDPVHGYVFRSKKDVFRYLETGDTSSCAIRPAKRNVASSMKDSPTTDDASSKKLGGFVTERPLFSTEEPKGGKSFGTSSPAQQVESFRKQPDCIVVDPNIVITSILADINEKHSFDLNDDGEIEPAATAAVKVGVKRSSPDSTPQSNLLPGRQLPENEPEKHSQSRKSRNRKSLESGRRVSKRLAGQNAEVAADSDLGEHALPAVIEKSASQSPPLNISGQELLGHCDSTQKTGNSDQASFNGEVPLDEASPGGKREIETAKKARRIRNDPPTTRNSDSKKLESSVSERQPSAAKESRGDVGAKRSVTDSPARQSRSSKKQTESGLSHPKTTITPLAADISSKDSCVNVIENAETSLVAEPETRESSGETKVIVISPARQTRSSKRQPASGSSDPKTTITPLAAEINSKDSCVNVIENAETSLDTEPETRESSGEAKVIASKRVEKQQLPENEPEKHTGEKTQEQQPRRSRKKKPVTPIRRVSKRLVGHSPEPLPDLDVGESALRAVVKSSASLSTPMKVSGPELSQKENPPVANGNSDQASLSRKDSANEVPQGDKDPIVGGTSNPDQASLSRNALVNEIPQGFKKETPAQSNDPKVGGTGDPGQSSASPSRKASVDEISQGFKKEILVQNKDSILEGTGNPDQASPSRKASVNEIPQGFEKQELKQSNDLTVGGTGNPYQQLSHNEEHQVLNDKFYQASANRKASVDEIPQEFKKEKLIQNKDSIVGRTGNPDQASPSRKASVIEIPPGFEKEILAQNQDSTVGVTDDPDQASPSGIPPGFEKEILPQNKNSAVGRTGTGGPDHASLRRKASVDDIPPGFEKEIHAESKDSTAGGTDYFDQASSSRDASLDNIPPGFEEAMLARNKMLTWNKNSTVGNGNLNKASLSKEAPEDGLPPGFEEVARNKNSAIGIGNSNKVSWRKEGSVDGLPPGWKKEIRIKNSARGIRKDPFYVDPVDGYGFRSKKDAMRYLETRDFSKCAIKPIKLDPDSAVKDNNPSTHVISSEKPACSVTGIQLFATEESKADVTQKHSCAIVNEDAKVRLDVEPEVKFSIDINESLAASPQFDVLLEQQPPEDEKEMHSDKRVPALSGKIRNKGVSKTFSGNNSEVAGMVADLDPCENFDQASLSEKADPLNEYVKCPLVGQAFEEKGPEKLTSEKQDGKRILQDYQPAEISHGSEKFHLEHEAVKERLLKEEQDSQPRLSENLQPTELAWGIRKLHVQDRSFPERPTAEQVIDVNMQWQESQKIGDLNLEYSSVSHNQTGQVVTSVSHNQTGQVATENRDDQSRRLETQLDSYPFGDYWTDPCMEFAFKTLTGAIPVENTNPFQASAQQDFNNSYHQADDLCFDLPVFDHHSFDMNAVPDHYASPEQPVPNEHSSINQTILPTGSNSNSMPGCSGVGSQTPGFDIQAKDLQSKVKYRSWSENF